jgi:hypothetical protein
MVQLEGFDKLIKLYTYNNQLYIAGLPAQRFDVVIGLLV